MRFSRARPFSFILPGRALVQRFAFALLIGAAIALMIISQSESGALERIRARVTDLATPVVAFFARPSATISDVVEHVESLAALREENASLTVANDRLMRWQTLALRLQRENDELRQSLKVVPDPRASYVTARIVGEAGGPFVRTALLGAGERDGVKKGQVVLGGHGLIGRIVDVGSGSARVLLITDLNSRVPVFIGANRARAVLAGDNSDTPRLEFLGAEVGIEPGDRVVTSGEGGVFPPGLPVGTIALVSEGEVEVRPYASWDRLEFVSVLNIELPAPLPQTRRAGRVEALP
ncbi:MAG: rod shape-determining protein MreC [Alphaproteobacteria bacterium]|nr:rod shape-determining protein MreC [Alphaproteobacteria bacterium]